MGGVVTEGQSLGLCGRVLGLDGRDRVRVGGVSRVIGGPSELYGWGLGGSWGRDGGQGLVHVGGI